MSISQKRGILERLDAGEVVIGDGGFVFALEKRGYVRAGPWTPEVNVECPSAGKVNLFIILRAIAKIRNFSGCFVVLCP